MKNMSFVRLSLWENKKLESCYLGGAQKNVIMTFHIVNLFYNTSAELAMHANFNSSKHNAVIILHI